MGSDSCQVLSGNMIGARFSGAQSLGEEPDWSVFPPKHFTVLGVTPRWCGLGWMTLPLARRPDARQVTNQRDAVQDYLMFR